MQHTIYIDQPFAIRHKLKYSEAAVYGFFTRLPGWADFKIIRDKPYYFSSRNMVCEALPLVTEIPDTMYRIYKSLEKKGLVSLEKDGPKDMVSLDRKIAAQWNNKDYSEKNPTLGKKSELGRKKIRKASDKNPTYGVEYYKEEEERGRALEISLVPLTGVNSNPVTTQPVAPILTLDEKYPNTEDKVEVIYQKCIAQLKADQTLFSRIILKARINITKNQFVVELRKWVEHYIHDSKFFANAHKRMDFGRGNMVNWLSSDKTRDQYAKLNAAQTTGKLIGESPFAKLAKLRQAQQTA